MMNSGADGAPTIRQILVGDRIDGWSETFDAAAGYCARNRPISSKKRCVARSCSKRI